MNEGVTSWKELRVTGYMGWLVREVRTTKMSVSRDVQALWMCVPLEEIELETETLGWVSSIEENLQEHRLRWFGHVLYRPISALSR